MSENIEQINQFLDYFFTYGSFWVYLVIFAICFIENLFPPFPGDTFIVVAGGLVALERLDLFAALLTTVAGGLCSVMMLYFFGRRYGRPFFITKDFKYFSVADIEYMEERLSRWGGLVLILSRFIVGMRVALAVAAGIGLYGARRMFVYSMISYLMFAGLLMFLGIKLVENIDGIEYYFSTYNRIVWPLVIGAVMIYVIYKVVAVRRNKRR